MADIVNFLIAQVSGEERPHRLVRVEPGQVGAEQHALRAGLGGELFQPAAVALARDFPNVFLELTAVFDDRGVLEQFVAEAGSERMLFGTDLPWFDPHQAVGVLLTARISDEDRHNICHRNAEKLLAPYL